MLSWQQIPLGGSVWFLFDRSQFILGSATNRRMAEMLDSYRVEKIAQLRAVKSTRCWLDLAGIECKPAWQATGSRPKNQPLMDLKRLLEYYTN